MAHAHPARHLSSCRSQLWGICPQTSKKSSLRPGLQAGHLSTLLTAVNILPFSIFHWKYAYLVGRLLFLAPWSPPYPTVFLHSSKRPEKTLCLRVNGWGRKALKNSGRYLKTNITSCFVWLLNGISLIWSFLQYNHRLRFAKAASRLDHISAIYTRKNKTRTVPFIHTSVSYLRREQLE